MVEVTLVVIHQYRQRLLQTATDTAAPAAGQELLYGSAAATAAGRHDASINGFADNTPGGSCTATSTCVNISVPDSDTNDAFYNVRDTAEAVIQAPNPTFFEKLFGINSVTVTTKAVAKLVDVPSDYFNGGTVNAPNCGLAFNSSVSWNNATVDAASITCASAGSCQNPHGSFTNAPPQTGAV